MKALILQTSSPNTQGYCCQYTDRSNVAPEMKIGLYIIFNVTATTMNDLNASNMNNIHGIHIRKYKALAQLLNP